MRRNAFTLVELLIVITIIAIIAGMSMAALMGAAEEGRRARAKSQITKLDQLISEKWNSYRFRQLPIRIPAGTAPAAAAVQRLNAMRELMRMEMPDRIFDVVDPPVTGQPVPAVTRSYVRYFSTTSAGSNATYDQAECLYAIISQMRDGDRSALANFMNSEIGDADGDGAYEILDPWGTPIMFLRWAPGYSKLIMSDNVKETNPPTLDPLSNYLTSPPAPRPTVAVSTSQFPAGQIFPDTFDPLKTDTRWSANISVVGFRPFTLKPLVFSAGPDKVYDMYCDDVPATSGGQPVHYNATSPPNDPYVIKLVNNNPIWVGTPYDYDGDGLQNGDNITNHGLELEGE